MKFSERFINKQLFEYFINYEYKLFNAFVYSWESDFFAISKSGYSIEVEVKISKADFKLDKDKSFWNGGKKSNKHDHLISDNNHCPNKFAYACPEGMLELSDIDPMYGLYWITEGGFIIIKREPKFLHKDKILENKHYLKVLLDKFYFRNLKLRSEMGLLDYDLKYGQQRIF